MPASVPDSKKLLAAVSIDLAFEKKLYFLFYLCISSSCLKIGVILTSCSVHNGHKYTARSVVGLRSFFESCVKLSKITHMVCAFRRRNIPLCSVYN